MKNPQLGPHDLHMVVSGQDNTAKIFNATGKLLRGISALPHGVGGRDWTQHNADTPPGLYLLGDIVPTLTTDPQNIHDSYGPGYIYLVEQEGQESKYGRGGCGVHGGRQAGVEHPELKLTEGCIRIFDEDWLKLANSLKWTKKTGGQVWVTVIQAIQ